MKYSFGISTLSIVCAISAGVSMPVFAAPAVRSLGSAGTYAGTAGAVSGVKSVAPSAGRAGTISSGRVGSTTAADSTTAGVSGNRVTSTRVAATPRLSIGKYLSGATIGGATGGATIKPGQSGVDTEELGERIDGLEVKVEDLANDIADLTGQTTIVEYGEGILTIIQGDKTTDYNLAEYFATQEELQALEDAINELVIPTKVSELENDAGYITQADIPSIDHLATQTELANRVQELRDLISGLDYVESDDLTDLNSVIITLQNGQVTNAQQIQSLGQVVDNLNQTYATDEELAQAIKNVQAGLAELENYYTKAESDARFQQVLNSEQNEQTEPNVIQTGAGVVKSVAADDGVVTITRSLIENADIADDAAISAGKIDTLSGFMETTEQDIEDVKSALDDVEQKFTDLQLDNVLHGIMEDGTYVIHFSNGAVSYSPVVFIGEGGEPIDMTAGSITP